MSSTLSDKSLVSSPEVASPSAPRTRTSKGKSRSGCMICKQRKVKCDEARPSCFGCLKRSHKCIYKVAAAPKWKQGVNTFVAASPTNNHTKLPIDPELELVTSSANSSRSISPALPNHYLSFLPAEDRQSFGIEDGLLLAHYQTSSSFGLIGDQELWTGDILQLAFQHNFLLHAVLTLASRHFQMVCHDQSINLSCDLKKIEEQHFRRTISELKCAMEKSHRGNKDALLATSFLMCFYSCSILDFKPSTGAESEDTSFIFLLGTRSLVIVIEEKGKTNASHSSIIAPLTKRPKWLTLFLPRIFPLYGPGGRLINLINRLPPGTLSAETKALYIERTESLTVYFSATSTHAPDHESVEGLSRCYLRWQTTCPPEFMSLVRSYDPVSLIILAHYYAAAGYVHMKADNVWWWWQKKPKYMVETIVDFLLPAWAEWLEWPLEMIEKF